jgi:sec-independent protein translocase protein TatB
MFANLSWEHLGVLLVAGLVVLGPERLPGAIRWSANALRQARDYIGGATTGLREEFGPEFDDLREPLAEIQKLRVMTPRAALTKHLLDGDDSLLDAMSGLSGQQPTQRFDHRADGGPPAPQATAVPHQPAPPSQPGPEFYSDAT